MLDYAYYKARPTPREEGAEMMRQNRIRAAAKAGELVGACELSFLSLVRRVTSKSIGEFTKLSQTCQSFVIDFRFEIWYNIYTDEREVHTNEQST